MLFIWLLDGAWGIIKNVSVSKSSLQTRGKKGTRGKTDHHAIYWILVMKMEVKILSFMLSGCRIKQNQILYWQQFILVHLNIMLKKQNDRPNWWLGKEYYFHSTFWNEAFYKNCSELWAIQVTKIAFTRVQPLLCSVVGFWIGCQ